MSVAIAVAGTVAFSWLFAMLIVRTPGVGVARHPRAALVAAMIGLLVATSAVVALIGAPMISGTAGRDWWPLILNTYFLAMANRLVGGPFPFFWTPHWMYAVGNLTPLIVLGGFIALIAGASALPRARRTAIAIVSTASCLLVAYLVAAVYAVAGTWGGVPL